MYETKTPLGSLIQSLVVTLLCCPPFGVVGVVFSVMAMVWERSGDSGSARRFVRWADGFNAAGLALFILGVLAVLIARLVGS